MTITPAEKVETQGNHTLARPLRAARDEQEELGWIRMQQETADRKTAALKAELERMKVAAESGSGQKNVRGSVIKALLPRVDILREATCLGTPITQQKEMLERAGIVVSYNSLRKFIQKFLAHEYRDFLANSRTTVIDEKAQRLADSHGILEGALTAGSLDAWHKELRHGVDMMKSEGLIDAGKARELGELADAAHTHQIEALEDR